MQRRQHVMIPLLHTGLCALMFLGGVSLGRAAEAKATPAGTWFWTVAGRNGGPERKLTLKLKVEGDKLTGKLITPGRNGQEIEAEIKDGKVKGDEISFTVSREVRGNTTITKYTGKVTPEGIKGTTTTERDGKTGRERKWEAKRQTSTTAT